MAKLQNVRTIDMVNGEITAIKYGGAVYTKVEDPRIGDICEIVKAWASRKVGEFHNVINITEYRDDTYVHIEQGSNYYASGFNYYRKAETATASAPFAEMVMARMSDVGAQVDAVERKVAAIEAKLAPETLTEGDRVLISGSSVVGYDTSGKFGTFVRVDDCGYYNVTIGGNSNYLFHREQLTKVAGTDTPVKPKTGDIVVITANTNDSHNSVGDIGKVRKEGKSGECAKVEVPGGETTSVWTIYSEMRLATPAEIALYEADVKQAEVVAKDSVFTKAGRKPNEYRKGDLVRFAPGQDTTYHGLVAYSGIVAEVESGGIGHATLSTMGLISNGYGTSTCSHDLEIVCFAENRADLAKGAC